MPENNTHLFRLPLAEKLRPQKLADFIGQGELISDDSLLVKMINENNLSSFILWGPPGTGKTTLANIISKMVDADFISFSAVTSSIKDVKAIMEQAKFHFDRMNRKTLLFIDEIHRFNKAQQDAFLSYVEKGSIILIGATTENPSYSIISPLLSRMRVFVLKQLTEADLKQIMQQGFKLLEEQEQVLISIDNSLLDKIAAISSGDARRCLGIIEMAVKSTRIKNNQFLITEKIVKKVLQGRLPSYDKTGDYHYDYISALHKSMRNSDVHAACYYTVKMLESGEDPLYVIRRVIQFSSEDVGLADSNALLISVAAKETIQAIGMPECKLAILQAVIYNALAPKSNSTYTTYQMIKKDILNQPDLPVPLQIRNPTTPLMKELNYGKSYQYAHDYDIPVTNMQCLPDQLKDRQYYQPKNYGFEKNLKNRMDKIDDIKRKKE